MKNGPTNRIASWFNSIQSLVASGQKSVKESQEDLRIKLRTDFILSFRKTMISGSRMPQTTKNIINLKRTSLKLLWSKRKFIFRTIAKSKLSWTQLNICKPELWTMLPSKIWITKHTKTVCPTLPIMKWILTTWDPTICLTLTFRWPIPFQWLIIYQKTILLWVISENWKNRKSFSKILTKITVCSKAKFIWNLYWKSRTTGQWATATKAFTTSLLSTSSAMRTIYCTFRTTESLINLLLLLWLP